MEATEQVFVVSASSFSPVSEDDLNMFESVSNNNI